MMDRLVDTFSHTLRPAEQETASFKHPHAVATIHMTLPSGPLLPLTNLLVRSSSALHPLPANPWHPFPAGVQRAAAPAALHQVHAGPARQGRVQVLCHPADHGHRHAGALLQQRGHIRGCVGCRHCCGQPAKCALCWPGQHAGTRLVQMQLVLLLIWPGTMHCTAGAGTKLCTCPAAALQMCTPTACTAHLTAFQVCLHCVRRMDSSHPCRRGEAAARADCSRV